MSTCCDCTLRAAREQPPGLARGAATPSPPGPLGAELEGGGIATLAQEVKVIAPDLITITMMQSAFFETTYSSYVRLFSHKTWDAVVATPLTIEDIMVAEMFWAAIRAVIYSTIMAIVVAAFGILTFPSALLLPVIGFFVGLMFAGLGPMATAKVPAIDSFSYVFYPFITP